MRQSHPDDGGPGSPDGWGLGTVADGIVRREREVEPAYESEEYRRDAARVDADTVVGHVRRATVGEARKVNTHPFRREGSLLAHNGHVPAFAEIRPRLLDEMAPELERGIQGTTDSEHVFHLLLTRLRQRTAPAEDETVREAGPDSDTMQAVLRETVRDLESWCSDAVAKMDEIPRAPEGDRLDRVALNLLWTVGDSLAGTRVGRPLWYLEREGAHRCGACGEWHPDPEPEAYRSVVLASERVTDEEWQEVPESSVFRVDDEMQLQVRSL